MKIRGVAERTKNSLRGWHPCSAGGCGRVGKSKRSGTARIGYRSDSTGIVDQFPSQRSSDSGLDALRLPRSGRLRNAKIFSPLRRCPSNTDATRAGSFSVCWLRIFVLDICKNAGFTLRNRVQRCFWGIEIRRTDFPVRRRTSAYLSNKSLCVPVRAKVSTRISSSMR